MDNKEENQDEGFYDNYYDENNDLEYENNDDESYNEVENNIKEEKKTSEPYYDRNISQKKSKILLISFYIMMVIVLIIIYLLYRSNKYAFYLKKDEILLKNGSEYQVELLPKDLRYFDYLNYKYSIDNEKVATVDKYGTINTIGIGEAKLKISIKFGFGTKVMKIRSEDIKVDSIELKVDTNGKVEQKEKITLYVNESITLRSFANKKDDFNINVNYTSSNASIASVNEFGVVTAKKIGTAIISGTKDGVSGSIIVEVKEKENNTVPTKVKVDSVDIGITNTTMYINDKLQLSAKVSPSNATGYTVKWTSSNNDIAEVSNNGLVTAKKVGTVVIKAVVDGKEASGTILVKEKQNTPPPVPQEVVVTGVTLNKTNLELEKGKTDTLVATISLSNATNKAITWSSSNPSVATVSNGVVTAITEGTTNITVTTANGKTATCVVTIKAPIPQEVAVTGVTLNKTTTTLEIGKTDTLIATISPSNATNKLIAWSSSNPAVATIEANGIVTGKTSGTTIITAKTNNGKTATCTVTVKENCLLTLQEGENQSIATSNLENINNYLQCAHRNGITSIKVPKGNYFFEVKSKPILMDFSNITLDLNGSTFNIYPNNVGSSSLIRINNAEAGNVTIKNGTLKGDRNKHLCNDGNKMSCTYGTLMCPNDSSKTHESQYGIFIASTDINIENLLITEMTGDGIIIMAPNSFNKSGSINILNNTIDYCRRNGISIIDGKNINIKNNIIRYTMGTWPQIGIDIERDNKNQHYENVLIEGNSIYGHTYSGWGIQFYSGIVGYLKIINNHLGDQIVGFDDGYVPLPYERELVTIANNDTNIPSGVTKCVKSVNEALKKSDCIRYLYDRACNR